MKPRGMPIMSSVANEDFLWVSQLILSFQKIKNQDISCELSHTYKKQHSLQKRAHNVVSPPFKAIFCVREVVSAALFKT